MAFPSFVSTNTSSGSSINKICNLPASLVSGNLLILELRSGGPDTHSTPTGWTAFFLNDTSDASDDTSSCWFKKSDGTEGATVTITATNSQKFVSLAYQIQGWDSTTNPVVSTRANGASTTPDPPALSPAGGAKDFLWIAFMDCTEAITISAFPTNYTLSQISVSVGGGGAASTKASAASAGRQLNTATEDPGTFTLSASETWLAYTIAVYPTVGAAASVVTPRLLGLLGVGT